jgi:hypothetical protein
MAVIRLKEAHVTSARNHLLRPGEHFAFFLARAAMTAAGPAFIVVDAELVPDDKVEWTNGGAELDPDALLLIINRAVREQLALIEAHNHGGASPRLSTTDRRGLAEFVPYVLESLPGRPYGVTVWGDELVHGEFFLPGGGSGTIRSITSIGAQLRQLVSRSDDGRDMAPEHDRQLAWFGEVGQRQLACLRIGVVGAGGTGSPLIQNLVYLGCRDFVVVDSDTADVTSMNRLVSASAADIETSKAVLARRLIRAVAPAAHVATIAEDLRSRRALDALKSVDLLFGCVDNDGARLVLTELASAYRIPYIDVAVGIEASDQTVVSAGARVFVSLPDGPCLHCAGEIDWAEASYFLAPLEEQEERRRRGYVVGMDVPAPAVVSLNGAASAAAATEFAVLASGVRPVNVFTELDLLGTSRPTPAQWMTPMAIPRDATCVLCAQADRGADGGVDRYALDGAELAVVE